jgi:glycine/D-amino acid oxidase-like deaminating enzyme
MSKFVGRSIDLMEELAIETDNAFDMTRRGYLYLTADEDTFASMSATAQGLADADAVPRCTTHTDGSTYTRSSTGSLSAAQLAATAGNFGVAGATEEPMEPLKGIDLLAGRQAVQDVFPFVDDKVVGALHARRAGWVSAQQMGVTLMNKAKEAGVTFVSGAVTDVSTEDGKVSSVRWTAAPPADGKPGLPTEGESYEIATANFVNAAGPMLNEVHSLIPGSDQTVPGVAALAHNDVSLRDRRVPLRNHIHVKVIFRDTDGAVPRDAPMMIWADSQDIGEDFRSGDDEEDRAWLTEAMGEKTANKLLGEASPGVHLRPYGPDALLLLWEFWHGDWPVDDLSPNLTPEFDVEMFPEVCIRGLSTMVPDLGNYIGNIPRSTLVDGGYYTETPELLPLVGPVGGTPVEGAWVCGGLAGAWS